MLKIVLISLIHKRQERTHREHNSNNFSRNFMLFEQARQSYSQHIGRYNKRSKSEYKIELYFTLSVHNNKVERHQKH